MRFRLYYRNSHMRWRILSAVVGWPALGVAVFYLPDRLFAILAAIAIAVACFEYLKLLVFPRNRAAAWLAFLAALGCIFLFWSNSLRGLSAILIGGALLLFAVPLVSRGPLVENLTASAMALAGVLYVAVPLGFIMLIRYLPRGVSLVGFLFLVTWARDLGAFLTGRIVRRRNTHFINQEISPNKTYEGAAGGIIAATVVAVVTGKWLVTGIPLSHFVLFGISAGVLGQVGDLVESMMKRVSHVTDSSKLIPGQGGLLDTLDSFIYTAPLWYLLIISDFSVHTSVFSVCLWLITA
jgi:phosphatidate cytidylyltransferase